MVAPPAAERGVHRARALADLTAWRSWAFAHELLLRAGQARVAGTVKPRFSQTAGGAYLSNGCEHCDAIQGDWPIGRAIFQYGATTPLSELPILATVPGERAAWDELVARQGMGRFGYPMRWEDLD